MIAYDRLLVFSGELAGLNSFSETLPDRLFLHPVIDQYQRQNFQYQLNFLQNQGRTVQLRSTGPMQNKKAGQQWAFYIHDVVTFIWRTGEKAIDIVKHRDWTPNLCLYWLLHTLLPIYFTIEETFCVFHAGSVVMEEQAVLFTAQSYGGKSTLTGFFLKQGESLVSDDQAATYEKDGRFFVVPSYPFHRPYRKAEDLGLKVGNFALGPKRIRAIFVLEQAAADAELRIGELQGIERFQALCFSNEINLNMLAKKRFTYLAQMAKSVSVYRIRVPRKMARLPEVYLAVKHLLTGPAGNTAQQSA